jgi:hypothetical protein
MTVFCFGHVLKPEFFGLFFKKMEEGSSDPEMDWNGLYDCIAFLVWSAGWGSAQTLSCL